MKIVKITGYEVVVPARKGSIGSDGVNKPLHKLPVGAKQGWSLQFDELPKMLLELELDSGLVGWGELYRGHNRSVVEDISRILLGWDIESLALQKLPFVF
jgi:muconate cycloisomerase